MSFIITADNVIHFLQHNCNDTNIAIFPKGIKDYYYVIFIETEN